MDPNTLKALQGAAGAGGDDTTKYVEEVFSTDVYSNPAAAPSPRTVTNGINFLEEGGLLWVKNRSYESGGSGRSHVLYSTANSATSSTSTHILSSNNFLGLQDYSTNATLTWKTDGWSVPSGDGDVNGGYFGDYAAWSFRKAPGFFDVVTYPGTGSAKTVAHNLGCVPGMIIVKALDVDEAWAVYHKSTGNTKYFSLSEATGEQTSTLRWNDTSPTDTVFTIGTDPNVNQDTKDYVAYLFADGDDTDAQIFGDDEDEAIIKCGTFTTSSSKASVNLGFEPQWVMFKGSSGTSPGNGWEIYNSMTGLANGSYTRVSANSNAVEVSGAIPVCTATATGFEIENTNNTTNFIYIAIRRGPMKTPEDATKVFAIDAGGNTDNPLFDAPFPVDCLLERIIASTSVWTMSSRLTGDGVMNTDGYTTESNATSAVWDHMDGAWNGWNGSSNRNGWMFRRAPGFMDVVCYEGTGSAKTEAHNLGVVPEMMIVKCRDAAEPWCVYHKDLNGGTNAEHYNLKLNYEHDISEGSSRWNDTAPDASVFTVGTSDHTNKNTKNYIAYLFATLPGISKVGTYTGNGGGVGNNQLFSVDCGFTAGARFVLIKRYDDDGDWYVFDTTRGINYGDDPYLLMNEDDAEVTTEDYVKPWNSGFYVLPDGGNSPINTTGDYIYLAIA